MRKELNDMAIELRTLLRNREDLVSNILDAYILGRIENVSRKIDSFEFAANQASSDLTLREEIIINFSNDAEKIKLEIASI